MIQENAPSVSEKFHCMFLDFLKNGNLSYETQELFSGQKDHSNKYNDTNEPSFEPEEQIQRALKQQELESMFFSEDSLKNNTQNITKLYLKYYDIFQPLIVGDFEANPAIEKYIIKNSIPSHGSQTIYLYINAFLLIKDLYELSHFFNNENLNKLLDTPIKNLLGSGIGANLLVGLIASIQKQCNSLEAIIRILNSLQYFINAIEEDDDIIDDSLTLRLLTLLFAFDPENIKDQFNQGIIQFREDFFYAIRNYYKSNASDSLSLSQDTYKAVQDIHNYLENEETDSFYKDHFGALFSTHIARFSIFYDPSKDYPEEPTFEQLNKHLLDNLKNFSCNPSYIAKWRHAANLNLSQELNNICYDKYQSSCKPKLDHHFFYAKVIAFLSTLVFVGFIFNLMPTLLPFKIMVFLGVASFIYSQYIIFLDPFKNTKQLITLQSYNVFYGMNAIIAIIVLFAYGIPVALGASLVSSLTLTLYALSLSSLLASIINKHFIQEIIKKSSLIEANKRMNNEIKLNGFDHLFSLKENANEIEFNYENDSNSHNIKSQ